MKQRFEDIFPLYKIEDNVLFNKYGDLAFCFKYTGKEMFSQDKRQLGELSDYIDSSFGFLDESFVIHKQEVCLESVYDPGQPEFDTYMARAQYRHFKGMKYYRAESYLYVIKTDVISLKRSYSTTRQPGQKIKRLSFSIEDTKNQVDQFCNHLSKGGFALVPLAQEETEKVLEGYFSFFQDDQVSDLTFSPDFKIGDRYGSIYALNSDENQPDGVSPFARNEDYSSEVNTVFSDFLYSLGIGWKANHIVNQIFFLDGQKFWVDALEKRGKNLESMRFFSSSNGRKADDNSRFQKDTVQSEITRKVVRMHLNIVFWADGIDQLKKLKGDLNSKFIQLGIKPHQANYLDMRTIYLSSCPGNAGTMPHEETFVTHSEQASCYFIKESVIDRSIGKPSTHGLAYVDRVSNILSYRDSWFKPYLTKLIENRNFLAIGKSGGGKSSTLIEKAREYLDLNFKLTVIDIGRSWELLCKEYDGNDIVYQNGMSLGINPFIVNGSILSIDQLEYLATFIYILWKPKVVLDDEKRPILEKVILKYYGAELRGKEYIISIDGAKADIVNFYRFVEENETLIKEVTRGRDDFFDYNSFLVSLDQFVTGKFSSLFVTDGLQISKLIDPKKNLTVWELDNIKDHETLFPIFAMLITYSSQEVLFNDVTQQKLFIYDEAWKIIEKPGMATNLRYQYKTARKFDAGVGIAIQTIGDLSVSPVIEETVLGNSDIKFIFKHSKDLVPALKEKLKLSDHHESLLLSVNNDFNGKYPYTEHLNVLGSDVKVVRNMVSPEQRVLLMSERSDKDQLYKLVKDKGDWHSGLEEFIKLKGWSA